jgi:hypothetical protein
MRVDFSKAATCLAYALMDNRYHLPLETAGGQPEPGLKRASREVLTSRL